MRLVTENEILVIRKIQIYLTNEKLECKFRELF